MNKDESTPLNEPLIKPELSPTFNRSATQLVMGQRSKTMGIRIADKRTMFQWTADGKLQEVKVNQLPEPEAQSEKETTKAPSKFG